MTNILLTLWRDEEGATVVEYVLLLALISVIAIVAITTVGQNVNTKFTSAADATK